MTANSFFIVIKNKPIVNKKDSIYFILSTIFECLLCIRHFLLSQSSHSIVVGGIDITENLSISLE